MREQERSVQIKIHTFAGTNRADILLIIVPVCGVSHTGVGVVPTTS